MSNHISEINRRSFIKIGAAAAALAVVDGCGQKVSAPSGVCENVPSGRMTLRKNPKDGSKVSLLGYGCMRLPTLGSGQDRNETVDQEAVNRLVDFAIEHGVNLFDTSPAYCKGQSETAMGKALSRYERGSYFVSTKLSNFAKTTWSYDDSVQMYRDSLSKLQVDYVDYYLLHAIGMGGMENLRGRYLDNGVLGFLLKEREAGHIRNLGFSYHGDITCFDLLLSKHDIYHWDFVLIQLNYVDWRHAKEVDARNTDAEYLYGELASRAIPAFVMEPLQGGRLVRLNYEAIGLLKKAQPDKSLASWAFRFAGQREGILSVLSGMTYMDDLCENIATFSPLKPLTDQEEKLLEDVAKTILARQLIHCNECQYCMPCPYGIDIPGIFSHYNKCLNEGNYADDIHNENYRQARRVFLIGYDRAVPKLRQADHCIGCGQCVPHCPQRLDIPKLMQRVDRYAESLKRQPL